MQQGSAPRGGRSTLYSYFPSREALLAALADAALTEAGERVRQARLDAVPIDEETAANVVSLFLDGARRRRHETTQRIAAE